MTQFGCSRISQMRAFGSNSRQVHDLSISTLLSRIDQLERQLSRAEYEAAYWEQKFWELDSRYISDH